MNTAKMPELNQNTNAWGDSDIFEVAQSGFNYWRIDLVLP